MTDFPVPGGMVEIAGFVRDLIETLNNDSEYRISLSRADTGIYSLLHFN